MLQAIKARLIDDAHRRWHRMASFWAAVGATAFWSGIGFAVVIWPTLADQLPLWFYISAGFVLSVVFGVARFWKQPGAE